MFQSMIFFRGEGFGAWCPLSGRDVVLRCRTQAMATKVLRYKRAQENKTHCSNYIWGGTKRAVDAIP